MSTVFGRYVEFEVLSEPWNRYQLSDGTILRFRIIVTNVLRTPAYDPLGRPQYQVINAAIFTVMSSKDLRGQPTTPLPQPGDLIDSVVEEVFIARPIMEAWNTYKLEDGTTVKIKPYITSIKRTSKYDMFGEPIYLINWQPVIDLDVPKQLWRRPGPTATQG